MARAVRWLVIDLDPLHESHSLRWLLAGAVGSNLCRQAMVAMIPLQMYLLTGSAALVGAVGVVQAVPLIAGSVLGGVLADSRNRLRLLVTAQGATVLVCVAFAASVSWSSVWLIFMLAMLNAVLQGIESPARGALIPGLVRPALLPAAYALNNTLVRTASVVGPGVTGLIVAQVSFTAAYLTMAAVLALGTIATALMRLPPSPPMTVRLNWKAVTQGLGFVRTRPLLRQCLLVDLLAMSLSMPRAVFPILGIAVLDGDASTVGLLHSAMGIGALVGMTTGGWIGRITRQGRAVFASVMTWSAAITAVGLAQSTWLALAFIAVAGAADAVSGILRMSIVQLATPGELRGRVTAFTTATFQSGPLAADARAGGIAELAGAQVSIVSGGVVGGLACAFLMLTGDRALLRHRPEWAPRTWHRDTDWTDLPPRGP